MTLLLELPDDAIQNIASLLSTQDLLQFLSTNQQLFQLSQSEAFWRQMLLLLNHTAVKAGNHNNNNSTVAAAAAAAAAVKRQYLLQAYVSALPVVEWKPILSSRQSPTGREGHLACTLGNRVVLTGGFTDDEMVYTLDTSGEVVNGEQLQPMEDDWIRTVPTEIEAWRHSERTATEQQQQQRRHHRHTQETELACVYGASLTSLDDRRAVRFGGFRGGGYSGACHQIALLTLEETTTAPDGEDHRSPLKATWQVILGKDEVQPRAYHSATLVAGRFLVIKGGMSDAGTHGCIQGEAILDTQTWTWLQDIPISRAIGPRPSARHGHSMIWDEKRNRLVMFGGGSGSDLLRSGKDNAEVWELKMGSSSPSSSVTTSNSSSMTAAEFQKSLPWEWNMIHSGERNDDNAHNRDADARHHGRMLNDFEEDSDDETDDEMPALEPRTFDNNDDDNSTNNDEINDNDNNNHDMEDVIPAPAPNAVDDTADNDEDPEAPAEDPNKLTDPEQLCLGRCHMGFKVGVDTVILTCGGGRPSTNGVLGYNLSTDSFFRPKLGGNGVLPPPRFTAAGALFGESQSYLLIHGGYCSQEGAAIGNISVLDLAPALQRELQSLPENPDFESYAAVTQDDVNRHSAFGHGFGHVGIGGMEDLLQNLFVELATGAGRVADPRERTFAEMMAQMGGRHGHGDDDDDDENEDDDDDDDDDDEVMGPGLGGAAAMMLNMLANGGIRMVRAVHDSLLYVCVSVSAWLTFCCGFHGEESRGRGNAHGNAHDIRSGG